MNNEIKWFNFVFILKFSLSPTVKEVGSLTVIMWKQTVFIVCSIILLLCIIQGDGAPKIYQRYKINKSARSVLEELKCGYDACPKFSVNHLNVHVVPHSHDDVGWLKTVDQYYYGDKGLIQKAGVQYILDSVVAELLKDKNRKFIYVESAFFFKWYNEQTQKTQEDVQMLVREGRLEFIGGAWSMNDEATTHYHSIIDQFTWGLHLLNETFGSCGVSKVGWQIDPFGHSNEMASIFTQMGYDGVFFARLDHEDKAWRVKNKTMEMIWINSQNLKENDLFTHALYNHYSPPPGFCYDILCNDEPINDDPESADNNVKERIDKFIEFLLKMAQSFQTNNLILTMGEDFHYQDANMWYKNLDKLIKYTNERQTIGSKINAFYSTPSCYLKAVNDANMTFPTKSDDFFPYGSDEHSFWTGYFTSRPTIKRFERVGNHFLQVCKQLSAFSTNRQPDFDENLNLLREAMGIMQHHDAVTGTEKQHVADDYSYLLHKAIEACGKNAKHALNEFVAPKQTMDFEFCHYLNVSSCAVSENSKKLYVTVWNPSVHMGYQYVRLPVLGEAYKVSFNGTTIASQMVPVPESVRNLQYRKSAAENELVFLANEIPPVGYRVYLVEKVSGFLNNQQKIEQKMSSFFITNGKVSLKFDDNGFLETVTANGASSKVRQDFLYYQGYIGNNWIPQNRSSGAYIFRPNGTEQTMTDKVMVKVVEGDLVTEVHQIFNSWVSQVVRLYHDESHAEFEWMVGSIPVEDGIGKEVISRFDSVIKSNGVFYTDSNGREMMKRVRNHRETWPLNLEEDVAGNYYPVTSRISVESDIMRMSVLNDRAQGGSSVKDGSVEVMVHRRLLKDDAFGVGEALNETAYGNGLIARGKLYLVFGHKKVANPTIEARERILQAQVLLPPWSFLTDVSAERDVSPLIQKSFASITLPKNVHLMTIEPWRDGLFLMRFEHILDKDEDSVLSKEIKFDLSELFKDYEIDFLRETTLSANQWKDEAKRLKFKPENLLKQDVQENLIDQTSDSQTQQSTEKSYTITLGSMEIKTFVVGMKPKEL